jgi:hypothetical protein
VEHLSIGIRTKDTAYHLDQGVKPEIAINRTSIVSRIT